MSDEAFTSRDVEVHRVRRRASRIAAQSALGLVVAPVLGAVLLSAMGVVSGSTEWMRPFSKALLFAGAFSWAVAAPIAMIVSAVASLRRRLRVGSIAVKDGTLELEGAADPKEIPGASIEGAIVRKSTAEDREAEIALKSGDALHVRVKDRGEAGADALVAALGFSGAKRRTVIPLGGARSPLWSTIGALVMGLVVTPLGACTGLAFFPRQAPQELYLVFLGLAFALVTTVTARVMTPRKLVVGADGVELHGPLRKRFFPRSRIFGVEKLRGEVSLLLRDGDRVSEVQLSAEDDARRGALVKCIREALEEQAAGHDPRSALLSRGNDAIGAWRDRVRKLVSPGEGYRASHIPAETLLRTISDADAPADVRVGAAMAIGSSHDEALKDQLRIATEAIVDEDLRVALEAASEAEAEDLAIQSACSRALSRVS